MKNVRMKSQLIKLIRLTVLVLIIGIGLVLRWYTWREVDKQPIKEVRIKTKLRRMQ